MITGIRRRQEEWNAGITHVTLNPREPGVVRIHLVPPKPSLRAAPYLVFLNGWWILPISSSEARLVRYFIEELDASGRLGQEISDEQMGKVLDTVCQRMQRMYPGIAPSRFRADLITLVNIFIAVAQGRELPSDFGHHTMTMADYAKHLSGPHRMDLIVSPMIKGEEWICPLHCKNCYAAGQSAMRIDRELTTKQWMTIIDRCWEIGIPQLSFTGGEPTKRLDLVDLIAHASQFVTRLNTSGVTMTPELAQALYEASLDAVQITLYSADKTVHDQLVGVRGAWEKTIQGIKNAVDAGLYVSVNTPLTRANADFVSTLQLVRGLGVTYISCSGLIPAGAAPHTIKQGGALENGELYQVLQRAVAYGRATGLELSFTSPGWLSAEQLGNLGLSVPVCGACLSNMAIAPNGAVVPCQSWLNDPNGLGNILTAPWSRIWDGALCKKIRARAATKDACPLAHVEEVVR